MSAGLIFARFLEDAVVLRLETCGCMLEDFRPYEPLVFQLPVREELVALGRDPYPPSERPSPCGSDCRLP